MVDDELAIPDFLLVKNRVPLTAEQQGARKCLPNRDGDAISPSPINRKDDVMTEVAEEEKTVRVKVRPKAKEPKVAAKKVEAKKVAKAKKAKVELKKVAAKSVKANGAAKSVKAKSVKVGNGERGAKTALVRKLLTRAGGCTLGEILEATGWPSLSVPHTATQMGLKLRREKKPGERTRYFCK